MTEYKGKIRWNEIWDKKVIWACEIINREALVNYTPEDLINLNIPCAIISAIIKLGEIEYDVDWTNYY